MKKYEAIVFDLGGTLIEYAGEFETWPELESPGLSAAHSVFRFHGIQMPSLSHFKAVGFNLLPDLWLQAISGNQNLTVNSFLMEILENMNVAVPNAAIMQVAATQYERAICVSAAPIPYAQNILEMLKQDDYQLGLISNTMFSGRSHKEDLSKFGMKEYFDAMLFSADQNSWKPTKKPFLSIVNELEVSLETALFIGDDPGADVAGAKGVGMDVILFAWSDRFRPIDGLVPDATIKHLRELPDLLAGLNS